MLTANAYLTAWGVHLAASFCLIAVVFHWMRGWRPLALRIVLCAVLTVWLVTPAIVEPGAANQWMAPAFVVLAFEWWEGYEAARRVLEPLLILTGVVTVVALFLHGVWLRWRSGRKDSRTSRPYP